ncbi:2'-5' RNA ligase family protein [Vulcanisaeta souniana]|uniref:RNA 2',3'-cyclic phosphodiesterase n=1 Tax=Vulcanisaeta souniana JCM 11219 TaxID=1293586 RepID=A0A830E074_9CREN|nr:2'-5' RNA ligase family protein [Vulcanisaeta souniana]BDR91887.1 RNA 2',3'-cyclic phosphodiesterase [Vulcanisaeta souniana JCM 11219]GGI69583.1 RNA 2',3'-cyclic phosphodiesterase [Vulcanisaeta souniana JCM 11219]
MGYFYGVFIKELNITPLIKALPVIPIEPENMHMTIVYIGYKRPSQETDNKIGAGISQVPCFMIKLSQLTLLPSATKPRVLAVGIVNNEQLNRLRSTILSALRNSGVVISDKYLGDFKPHITIAYIKSKRIDSQDLIEMVREMGIEEELTGRSLLIDSVSLILAKGSNYSEVSSHELQCVF